MKLKSRRRKRPQAPPTQSPAGLPEEQAAPSSPPPSCKRKHQVPKKAVCRLCQRTDCDPEVVGQLCQYKGLSIHENCLYQASRLIQRGADEDGFYGFLFPDIRQELKRVANKKCCICRLPGASVTCRRRRRHRRRRCSRIFHFPCGVDRGCISQFFKEFKSFCWKHRPVQRVRAVQQARTLCLICQEVVAERPSYDTLVCPACTRAWFHRRCIQGQALRSAKHHFRCPLCQDMDTFQKEMLRLGIKIPDRDAAWEEEEEAFADLYQQYRACDATLCLCPGGREEAEEKGPWRLLRCSSCGSCGTHQLCSALEEDANCWECSGCSGIRSCPPLPPAHPAQGASHSTPAPDASAEEEEAGILKEHPNT